MECMVAGIPNINVHVNFFHVTKVFQFLFTKFMAISVKFIVHLNASFKANNSFITGITSKFTNIAIILFCNCMLYSVCWRRVTYILTTMTIPECENIVKLEPKQLDVAAIKAYEKTSHSGSSAELQSVRGAAAIKLQSESTASISVTAPVVGLSSEMHDIRNCALLPNNTALPVLRASLIRVCSDIVLYLSVANGFLFLYTILLVSKNQFFV